MATDGTWVRSFEPEMYSRKSGKREAPLCLQSWQVQSKLKMLMNFAYVIRGVFIAHKVPTGKTVTAVYFKEHIQKYFCKKSPEPLAACTITLHDIATPLHGSQGVTSLFEVYKQETPPLSFGN